jgi:hypothetical protein
VDTLHEDALHAFLCAEVTEVENHSGGSPGSAARAWLSSINLLHKVND